MTRQEHPAEAYSRITYEDFGEDVAAPPVGAEAYDDADVASAVYTAVDDLLLDEAAPDPQPEAAEDVSPQVDFTDAVARDLLASVSIQLERIKAELHQDQMRVATFLASTMMRVVDTLATHPSTRPEPAALPRMLGLMQAATRSQAPIEIRASGDLRAALQRGLAAENGEGLRVTTQDDLPAGVVALSWAGTRASWRPDLILSQMTEIMRQFGLYAEELERFDDVR